MMIEHRRKYFNNFSPTDITKLALWLDASDASTITLSGDKIIAWADKSINKNNVTQTTDSYRPVYVIGEKNGKNVIRFTRTSTHSLFKSSPTGIGTGALPFTVVTVSKYGTYTNQAGAVIAYGLTTGNRQCYMPLHLNMQTYPTNSVYLSNHNNDRYSNNSFTVNNWYIMHVGWSGDAVSAIDPEIFINKTLQNPTSGTGSSIPDISASALNIGMQNQGTNHFNSDIAEIIFYSKILNVSERQRLESYLAGKWGI